MKTINKQLRDALRPIKQDLRQPPKRILIAKVRETEADEWIGFIGRNTNIIPLRLKK
jgi:hypothetical protein